LYHGHNTQNFDMLAVTAACMLIRKSIFDKAGGFDEEFAVAYNDVAFCFRLYQRGYLNVQVNEAVLIHHESLSRGQDTSPEKQKRLMDELARLYNKYPMLKAKDPFYSPNLVQWKKDVEYHANYLYAYDKPVKPRCLQDIKKQKPVKKYNLRKMLYTKCGALGKIYDRITSYHLLMAHIDSVEADDQTMTITGWCVLRNHDNSKISRKLWLEKESDAGEVYEFDILPRLREDVAALFDNHVDSQQRRGTRNAALAGIQIQFEEKSLTPGMYQMKLLVNEKQLLRIEDDNSNPVRVEIRKV
ncbi:MAG: hypothetical protein K2M91_05180, partial [Lachnospiraceae bacterium]|nr:hypothetical protein [Lachnospiraceae bacterium]